MKSKQTVVEILHDNVDEQLSNRLFEDLIVNWSKSTTSVLGDSWQLIYMKKKN